MNTFFPLSQATCVLFFKLNGIMLGLCSGRKFAPLTAGLFDVLLQSLPKSLGLLASAPISPPSRSLSALCLSWPCVPLVENWYTHTHMWGVEAHSWRGNTVLLPL